MKDLKVLITGCGRHSKTLIQTMKNNIDGRKVEVIGINNSAANILRTDVDKWIIAPSIYAPDYIDWLLNLCVEEGVDVVLPYITAELPILADKTFLFENRGIKVSIASPEALRIANDKVELSKRFHQFMPRQAVCHNSSDIRKFAKWVGYYSGTPICCKLADKCGGTGFAILDETKYLDIGTFNKIGVNRYMSIKQICEIADKVRATIIMQEYVQGTDYSVCVLARKGLPEIMCGFAGYAMEFGAVTSGEILKNDEAYEIAETVTEAIGLDGNACFDFMLRPDGKPVLLECNPRISATIPFIAKAGADLVYLRCKQLLNEPFDTDIDFDYGLKMVKYYEAHYFK